MAYNKKRAVTLLQSLDLGSSIAEEDDLLETARVETSAFSDLLKDKVDLIPGTKGSGKSALFRMVIDFLPEDLLDQRKVVVAHGVQHHGDNIFGAFNKEFDTLDEDEFVSFWCIYLISLAHEQFIKSARFKSYLKDCSKEIASFIRACDKANIPEIKAKKSLKDILQWTLFILSKWKPKATYKFPDGDGAVELDLFGDPHIPAPKENDNALPIYMAEIKQALDAILTKAGLSIWLMIDRLDEIFPRRSELENKALRALLRTMRIFSSKSIRVKIFLRDDMLDHIVSSGQGFTALTHITARSADTLRWSEDQILTMIVNRLFANKKLSDYLEIDHDRLHASLDYRRKAFYKVFPPTVHKGSKQSATIRWIYNRVADGRDVVTPRDVIDLLSKAKQKQQDDFRADLTGESEWLIGPSAIQYGLSELSIRKRITYLQAEFPHLWENIKKFVGGKTEYSSSALQSLYGRNWESISEDLVSIGVLKKKTKQDKIIYWIPVLFREGLELSQGRAR